jgi:hypothetical protein
MACGAITQGSAADCLNIPDGGTNARLILFNYDDIEGYTEDADGVITDIELVDGATGYEFMGFRNDVKKSEDVIKPEIGVPKFKHVTSFVIYENTQEQKNNVENLARGTFVAIVENKGKNANSFEVMGKGVGLEIVAGPIRNAYENGGFFVINLATADDQNVLESKLPQTLLATNYAGTLALIESLLPAS